MGQIFNRIKRIIRSERSSSRYHRENLFQDEDEELKRIIDELNSPRNGRNRNSGSDSRNESSSSTDAEYNAACKVLGVKPEDDFSIVKEAYKKLIREYHPDKFHNMTTERKAVAERKSREINSAYDYIRKVKGIK